MAAAWWDLHVRGPEPGQPGAWIVMPPYLLGETPWAGGISPGRGRWTGCTGPLMAGSGLARQGPADVAELAAAGLARLPDPLLAEQREVR